ncbi:hypothetical protein ABMA27_003952 [Loxostege sticticalis]|uniref:Peptidase S1 domain-containing protein n=1 Tax=Loxostege sticticalis TaxID=481309 RepID=A0ABR3HQY7_LOXSC
MRVVVLTVVALVACASALSEVPWPRGYHEEVGIPLAAKIKEAEEGLRASRSIEGFDDRIIGGVMSTPNAHPYFAGLLIDILGWGGQSVCGSVVLSSNRLVTAAHCWQHSLQAWRFTAVLGTTMLYNGGTRISTTQVFMHPQYNPTNLVNDIAMIYLPRPVQLSASIRPVQLPWQIESFAGQWAVATGFGKTSDAQQGASPWQSTVNLQVISLAQCLNIVPHWANSVVDSTICTSGAGGVGVCGGDSGGPLVINRHGQTILVGISSFAAQNACQQGWPSGFVRVTSFLNFISQHMW